MKAAAAAAKQAEQAMEMNKKTRNGAMPKGGGHEVHGFAETVERLRSAQKKKLDEREAYDNLGKSTDALWQKVGAFVQFVIDFHWICNNN